MFVVTPQVTKIIRRDPFLLAYFNIPKSNRELVNDIFTDEYDIISFGTVKYQRVHPVVNIEVCANETDTRKLYSFLTDEEYHQFVQLPAIFLYLKKDIYEEIDSMTTAEKIQYCSYLNKMIASIKEMRPLGEIKILRKMIVEFMLWLKVDPEDVHYFEWGNNI